MSFLQRRRARLLINRAQPFADEPLVAAANFTRVGSSMGSPAGSRSRDQLAGGLPAWSLIAAGRHHLYVIQSRPENPDRGLLLVGSWRLENVRMEEQSYDRALGPVQLGSYRAIRFGFPDRDPAVLQPIGREVDGLLDAYAAAQPVAPGPDGLTQVALMTTSQGSFEDDVFFVLSYVDGSTESVPLGADDALLTRLQALPGFDEQTFARAMAVTQEGMSVLWRATAT